MFFIVLYQYFMNLICRLYREFVPQFTTPSGIDWLFSQMRGKQQELTLWDKALNYAS